MADNKKTPLWLDRHQILDPAHADWLETQAAISEFGNGMPREEAEAKAYADYKRKHSAQAAAHHLAGMRAASGEEAKQHGAMYALHCKQLGFDPSGPVPDEVKAHLNSDDFKHPVKFTAHKADSFVLESPKPVEDMGKAEIDSEYMVALYKAAKMAVILGELAKSTKASQETMAWQTTPALIRKVRNEFEDGNKWPTKTTPMPIDSLSWNDCREEFACQRCEDHGAPDEYIAALVKHIKRRGKLPPIVVEASAGGYELLDGNHRLTAAADAGMTHVPALVVGGTNTQNVSHNANSSMPTGKKTKSVKMTKFDDYDDEDSDSDAPLHDSTGLPAHEIDHSAYGWWIRPDGQVINIPGETTGMYHEDAAPEIQEWANALPEYNDIDFADYRADDFAHALGFVRAVKGHGFELQNPLTDQQRSTMAKLWPHFGGGNVDVRAFNRDVWSDVSPITVPIPMGSNPARVMDHVHKVLQTGHAAGEYPTVTPWEWKEARGYSNHFAWPTSDSSGAPYFLKLQSGKYSSHYDVYHGDDFVGDTDGKADLEAAKQIAVSHYKPPAPKPTGKTLAKTLVPPVQASAPALHGTVEGFAGGLKALPKGSPERLRFITKHMSHAPFLRALQAHPQGKALHGQLMGILNSHANAGLRPGATVATAKNELGKNEVVNSNPSFFLDEEHQLPTHFETEGYRLHLSHNGADTHVGTVHRGGNVVGRVELVPGGFREEWNNPRHGLDSAVKMVLSAHANRQPVVDGWNNAIGTPVAKLMAKATPGFTGKVQGAEVTSPHSTYAEASAAKPKNMSAHGNKNLWVRQSSDNNNSNRTLMVQFSSDLLQGNRQRDHSDDYYDKLYKNREGYHRPDDFWELPQWQAHLANSMPNADHYTIRDPKEAIAFANAAGYKNVAFSALDVNRDFVKEFAQGYKGNVVVGGYTDMSHFAGLPNVKVHNTIQDFVESEGGQYNPGYDYRHFSGTKTIPRLTLSDGCAHKCAFCCVPKQVTEKTRDEIMQQVDSFSKHLPSDLIYLNDKTFGQAPNHAMLPEIYQRIKAANPNFKGFIVQTTAAQLKKMDPEFLRKAGIRHVEIGVESYNDSILRAHKKPANEQLIDESAQKLRNAGIGLIPNIMVGLPGEDQNTYKRTMDWLNRNSDIVSHVNAYNLALYDESELGKKIGALSNADKDENQITKSFHVNPQVHKDFANELFAYASRQLDKHPNVVIKAEGAKPKVKAKAWKSKDGITIPHYGTPERAEWDKRFRQALIENFAGGNASRLKPVKVDPNLATTTNMPVNKARLELYKQMAKKDKLPPIIVRKAGRGYVVIDGNHRFAAAVDAKLPHVDGYELVMPK